MDDRPGQHNPDSSEDPWGGGLPTLHGGASARNRPDTERDIRGYDGMHEALRVTCEAEIKGEGQRHPENAKHHHEGRKDRHAGEIAIEHDAPPSPCRARRRWRYQGGTRELAAASFRHSLSRPPTHGRY